MRPLSAGSGQAAVELVAAALVLVLAALAALYVLAAGHGAAAADNAAEAAALAAVNGRDPAVAARAAAPRWARPGMRVSEQGDRVTVSLTSPAPLGAPGRLAFTARATVRRPDGVHEP
jgi:hypothetical protein